MSTEKELIERLLKKTSYLANKRANFDNVFIEVAKNFRPIKTDIVTQKVEGDKSSFDNYLLDSSPVVFLETLAAIFIGIITNRSSKWFQITTEEEELSQVNLVSEWLNDSTNVMQSKIYNSKSNFEQSHFEAIKDIITFGTIANKVEKGGDFILNYMNLHIREFLIEENWEGKVDGIVLRRTISAQHIVERWGEDGLHESIVKAAKSDHDQSFNIELHIERRRERDASKIDVKNKRYAGFWIDTTNKKIIEETGYDSFPVAVGRSEKSTSEIYGTSRAMMALADARQLQRMWHDYNSAVEKSLSPPMDILAGAFEKALNLSKGAANYRKASGMGGDAVRPILTVKELASTQNLIQEKKQSLREVFFLDKLKIIDNPNATATQVMELRAEGFRIMSSIATSIQEYLESLLDRTFDILFRESFSDTFDLLPGAVFKEMPDELKSAPPLKVKFINPITEAQQIVTLNAINTLLQTVAATSQIDPSSVDVVNFDEILRQMQLVMIIDPKVIRDVSEVAKIRDARQQQQAQAQEAESANLESQTMKNMQDATR